MDLLQSSNRYDSSSSEEEDEAELQGGGDEPAGVPAVDAIQDVVDAVPALDSTNRQEAMATTTTTSTSTTTTCRSRRRSSKRGIVTVSSSTEKESGSTTTKKRIRQQAHVDGNWAGLCFLPIRVVRHNNGTATHFDDDDNSTTAAWMVSLRLDHRLRLAKTLCQILAEMGYSGHCHVHHQADNDEPPLHISLSRPFYLQQSNLQPFVRALSDELKLSSSLLLLLDDGHDDDNKTRQQSRTPKRCERGRGGPFRVTIDTHEVILLTNDDATRSFVAWKVHEDDDDEMTAGTGGEAAQQRLERLTECCNRVLCSYQQPVFYDKPQFHISWASFVPAIAPDTIRQTMMLMNNRRRSRNIAAATAVVEDCSSADINEDDEAEEDDEHRLDVTITHLCVKFGTVKLFEIPL